jgi:hypothetical protein
VLGGFEKEKNHDIKDRRMVYSQIACISYVATPSDPASNVIAGLDKRHGKDIHGGCVKGR